MAEQKEEQQAAEQEAKPNPAEYKDWIKMSPEEMLTAQKNGTLMGYHPSKGLGLVKAKESKKS